MGFNRKRHTNSLAVIGLEKSLIMRCYSHLDCQIKNSILYCYGSYQPTVESSVYNYRVKYNGLNRPVVHVTSPQIEFNDDIHMYPDDNSLCLYHKTDLVWNSTYHLYNTIIPWTHEWFVFYELYELKGEWLHPYVPHKKEEKK
jgi:hypothetical protein